MSKFKGESKRKKNKMTVKEELEDAGEVDKMEEDNDELIEDVIMGDDNNEVPEEEEGALNELVNMIESESTSGTKVLKKFVESSKEICKVLTKSSSLIKCVTISNQLSEKIRKVCEKYSSSNKRSEKAVKLISSLFPDEDSNKGYSCQSTFFRTLLKYGMNGTTNPQIGSCIIEILQFYTEIAANIGRVNQPTLGIQMIISHSSAASIFLEEIQFAANSKSNQSFAKNKSNEVAPVEFKYLEIKTQLLKLWKHLVIAFTKVSKTCGTPNDKKILENSVPYLFQMYSATMSDSDQEIFQIIQEYTGKRLQISIESMPLFGPKSLEPVLPNAKASNPLFAHSSRANTVLGLINERQAFRTAMGWRVEGFNDGSSALKTGDCSKHYDFKFLLPLVCHLLDSRNICDAVKVITHGWIYLIVRGLSFEDDVLRNLSFLAYKLLIQNFELPKKGYKMQDIKVWLHFLLSAKKGMQTLGKCKLSNLLSVWMVATWEGIRQPANPMYQRLTTLLFAKPTIDLSILPDFIPFYNAVDGNRATREWILSLLSNGLQTRHDWQVAQKLPTINSMCSSFIVESVFVQREILTILTKGAFIPDVAQEMVDKHSLLLWIANVILTKKQAYGKELHELFITLKENCPNNEYRQLLFQHSANMHEWTC